MLLKALYNKLKKERSCLGIDIGSSSIKAVVLSKQSDRIELNSLITVDLSKGTLQNKEISDPKQFETALKQIRSDIPKHIKNVSIAITGSQVNSKIIQVDRSLTETEIEYYLYANLSLITSKVVGEVNLDFAIIGENKVDERLKDVLVVVAKRSLINARALALRKSGFHCAVVDLESHCLMRVLQLQAADELLFKKGLANLHIGKMTTLFIVIAGDALIFSRELNIGTEQLIIDGCQTLNHVVADKLISQVKHYLQNYSSMLGGKAIETWFCSGGGCHFAELIGYLATALEADINICEPFKALNCADPQISQIKQELTPMLGRFHVALGLAVRGLM